MFLADAIAPIAKRVLRMLGIDTKETQTWLWPEQKMASDFGELAFKVGQQLPNKVWVVLDGVTHECEGTEVADGNALNFGNEAVNGGENTGEPFWFQFNRNSTNVLFIPINPDNPTALLDDREYTLGIYTQTETITPINKDFIPWDDMPSGGGGGSAPVVVDLKQFNDKNFNGMSINDELLTMVSQGLQANGALQTKTAAFDDSALFNTLSTDSQVVVTMDIGGDTILRFNPTASCLWGGKASLFSFGALMMQGYTVYELKVLFFFVDDTGTEMEIHLQAKPVA